MEKLKDRIAAGFVTIESTTDGAKLISRRFDQNTGAETDPQVEYMKTSEIEYYITLRQQQLEDLQEIIKSVPKKVGEN